MSYSLQYNQITKKLSIVKSKKDWADIVRIKNGKYFGHWGISTLSAVLAQLKNAHQ